ncbi:multimodular transpeptidase-transglycosylase [Lachnospiraceae bacterium KM106-2]|nr:multimodular transpeptidase-transglycosylase [Lachnospiraceae bacterium KM106-2]
MKKILKRLTMIIVLLFLLTFTASFPVIGKGYEMYQEAMDEKSLTNRIWEYKQDSNYVTIDNIAPEYQKALVQTEDQRFYDHHGVDPLALMRALYNDIKAGAFVEGGSTITQQLAKNMCFPFDKRLERKVAEVFVAKRLEQTLTKDEILELYCNIVYFGNGCYGIKEASNYYYGISPDELTDKQSKALVRTLRAPNRYNPKEAMYATQ